MSLSGGAFRSTLVFSGTDRVDIAQVAVTASYEMRASKTITWQVAAGGLIAGRLTPPDGAHNTGAGGVVSGGISWNVLESKGAIPFVMISASASVSLLPTYAGLYSGIDVRAGVAAGYTFLDRITPYLTVRGFGGPVFWRQQVGTDVYHFQVGLGLVVGLPGGFDVSAEVIPLGEQRVFAAVGYSF